MSSNFVDPNPTTAEIRANYVDSTRNAQGLYGRPLVLDRIFSLLVALIDSLQKCAAVQANRLNFLSQWQKAYTDQMNQIHAFVAFNGDGIGIIDADTAENFDGQVLDGHNTIFGPATLDNLLGINNDRRWVDGQKPEEAVKARSDMNTLNTNFTQQMQGNRQVISDDAKALQTSVNQTNDAVQQQTDMATSILQQLSTILTSIFAA